MFPFLSDQQRATILRDGKAILAQAFVMFPLLLLALAWVIWWAAGLPGNDLDASSLDDVFKRLVFIQMYLVAVMAGPVIFCYLSEPAGIRLAIWTFTASLVCLLPRVGHLLETLGVPTTAQPVPAALGSVRFTIRPQPPIPSFGFSPGVSPQLE